MWNNATLKALGLCKDRIKPKYKFKWKIDYVIVDQDFTPLRGRIAAKQMGLFVVHCGNFKSVRAVHASVPSH